ncbi:hypothetical protein Droror1_Dr00002487 [Drosera rotundifolia]
MHRLTKHLIKHPTISRSFSSLSTLFLKTNTDPLAQITRILTSSSPIEHQLDKIEPLLTPQLMESYIKGKTTTQVSCCTQGGLGRAGCNPYCEQHRDCFISCAEVSTSEGLRVSSSCVSCVGFRFVIWAMRVRRFRVWEYEDFVIDMVVKGNGEEEDGFGLYWRAMEEVRDEGISVPADAFGVLVLSYWKAGEAEKAVEAFERMVSEFRVEPDVHVYNKVMYVAVKTGLVMLARVVYQKMMKSGCEPSKWSYNILLDGLCKSGQMEDALRLFDEMTERAVVANSTTYTIVLYGLCRAKRMEDALRLYDQMRKNGCRPDTVTYNALLGGFCKVGGMDYVLSLLRSFESDGYSLGLNGFSCIIDGLFRAGRFEEAKERFVELCEKVMPDVAAYTIMIRGYCNAGFVMEAKDLLHEMCGKGLVPDTQCYNSLIKGFCYNGLLDNARSLKLEISQNNCFPDACTYTILICGLCRNGLVGEAEQIFKEMEKVGCTPTVVTFNALIDGLCRAGDLEGAMLLFSKMEVGANPLVFLRLSQGTDRVFDQASLLKRIERLSDSGMYVKAYKDLMELADNRIVPDITTWNTLIKDRCRNGDVKGAMNLVRNLQLKGLQPDSITYGTLIDGLYRSNKEEQISRVLDMIKKSGEWPRIAIYKSMMTWSCRKGKVSAAFNLWIDYLRSLGNRDEESLRHAEEHFQKGKITEAVEVLLEMDFYVKELNLAPYTIWLIGLCQAQRLEEALGIFRVLVENEVHVTAPSCVMLIRGLCQENKLDLATDVFMYSIKRGIKLLPPICDKLISRLLRSQDHRKHAYDLSNKMVSAGYDILACLRESTRFRLLSYSNALASVIAFQEMSPSRMASLECNSRMGMDSAFLVTEGQQRAVQM